MDVVIWIVQKRWAIAARDRPLNPNTKRRAESLRGRQSTLNCLIRAVCLVFSARDLAGELTAVVPGGHSSTVLSDTSFYGVIQNGAKFIVAYRALPIQ
jgi:hypothetical protein